MELRDYLRGLRRHWLAIVLLVVVGAAVGYGWTKVQTPVYEATASGFVKSSQTSYQSLQTTGDPAAQAEMPTYLNMAEWRDVAEYVITDLNLHTTPQQLVSQVSVTNPSNTTILQITAKSSTPQTAQAIAQAWVQGLIHTADKYVGNGKAGSAPVTIRVADAAALPTTPIFPDLRLSLIIGALLGLGFGVAFALMRTASDRRVRSAAELEKRAGVAVAGTIPYVKPDDGQGLYGEVKPKGPGFAVAEALRTLRTNLQFMDVDNPPRIIVVTSPLPGDGKSVIACNLAATLAASGVTVTLVDGDLRRSRVAKILGVSGTAGLSDVLAGRAELGDLIQRTKQSPNLYVLAAGTVPPNPSEVLGSARMKALLTELAVGSIVIVDSPPLLPVTDGAVLAHQADGALLVVSHGRTNYDLVEKSLDTLRKARGRALGIVLNKVPLKGADSSPYSRYEYRYENTEKRSREKETVVAEQPVVAAAAVAAPASPRPEAAVVPASPRSVAAEHQPETRRAARVAAEAPPVAVESGVSIGASAPAPRRFSDLERPASPAAEDILATDDPNALPLRRRRRG
jgi:capsular exopolysaccharide synthesis family protein